MSNGHPSASSMDVSSKRPREAFVRALAIVKELSVQLRALSRALGTAAKLEIIAQLLSETGRLQGVCQEGRWLILAAFSSALHKLLQVFHGNVERINISSLRTAANAVDFLTAAVYSSADLSSVESAHLRALVIDDNQTCRQAMVLALKSEHLEVSSASAAKEALAMLRQGKFDVVFTDIMMPGLNGFDLVKELRKLPYHTHTPVVFVTALSDFETRSKSVLSGGSELVGKPIVPSEFLLKALTFALRARFSETTAANKQNRTGN